MNEMTSVTTNGSWVTTIMKISAGSSGARRAQSPATGSRFHRPSRARWCPRPPGLTCGVTAVVPDAMSAPSLLALRRRRSASRLALVQGLVDRRLPGDRRS